MALFRLFPLVLLLLCVSLIGAAPLPEQNPSLTQRNEDLQERSFYHLLDRDIQEDGLQIASRSFAEEVILVRRESIAAKIRHGIKKGFEKVGEGIKKAAKKVGEGVKTAAKKVGEFAKETGAKIVKVGLEAVATAQSIGAKVAKVIPGIGKPISAALTAESKGLSAAAEKIPAKLSPKEQMAVDTMKKVQDPVGGAAGVVLKAFRRDIHEDAILFERDAANEDILPRFADESADWSIFERECD